MRNVQIKLNLDDQRNRIHFTAAFVLQPDALCIIVTEIPSVSGLLCDEQRVLLHAVLSQQCAQITLRVYTLQ